MKPNVSFADLARRLTDAWLESSGRASSPDAICRSVEDLLKINMVLIIVDTGAAPPHWRIDFVKKYGIPTQLLDAKGLQKSGNLGDFTKSGDLERPVFEVCQKAIADRRPITGKVDQVIQGARLLANGIVLPDPTAEKAWCVILCEVLSISKIAREMHFDDIDLSIVQLLREGLPAREIGNLLELSRRTIEHRIEKMKSRAGINSIVPLLTMRA